MDSLLPYVSNVEKERLSTQSAYNLDIPKRLKNLEFIASDALIGKPIPTAIGDRKEELFSDDESSPH